LKENSDIPPIQLFTKIQAYRHALNTDQSSESTAEVAIRQRCEQICYISHGPRRAGRYSNHCKNRRGHEKQTGLKPPRAAAMKGKGYTERGDISPGK